LGNQNESEQFMKTDRTPSSSTASTVDVKNDHSKLVSLLALAAGAAAMPQTGNADIIFSDQGATVSWGGLRSFVLNNLPGNAQLGFTAHRVGIPYVSETRYITGGKRGSGYVQMRLMLVSQPLLWSQINATLATRASFASAQSTTHSGNGYTGLYLAFEFRDSSQAGTPMRYGWAQLSLANGNLISGNNWPALTILGWAYDNTGAQIPMGATASVPEPSAMTLLALGALTLGRGSPLVASQPDRRQPVLTGLLCHCLSRASCSLAGMRLTGK